MCECACWPFLHSIEHPHRHKGRNPLPLPLPPAPLRCRRRYRSLARVLESKYGSINVIQGLFFAAGRAGRSGSAVGRTGGTASQPGDGLNSCNCNSEVMITIGIYFIYAVLGPIEPMPEGERGMQCSLPNISVRTGLHATHVHVRVRSSLPSSLAFPSALMAGGPTKTYLIATAKIRTYGAFPFT